MKRSRTYWICQWLGWGLYGTVNGVFVTMFIQVTPWILFANFTVCFSGIAISDVFRTWVRRNSWTRLPLLKAFPRVLVASLVMALSMELFAHLVGLFNPGEIPPFQWAIVIARMFNFSIMFFLWSLIYFGVHYFQNYKNSEIDKLRLESALKDAELLALKSQMNPHFLFNALNSIRALTVQDAAKAQEAITRLASILRTALQFQATPTVPLEQELQTVDDYLALESVRLEERLTIEKQIDPSTLKSLVPTMLVQTLAENGIKHGVSQLASGGVLKIQTMKNAEELRIVITNSGSFPSTNGHGVGLQNIRQRLKLLYGDLATIRLEENSGPTVTATVTIPEQMVRS